MLFELTTLRVLFELTTLRALFELTTLRLLFELTTLRVLFAALTSLVSDRLGQRASNSSKKITQGAEFRAL